MKKKFAISRRSLLGGVAGSLAASQIVRASAQTSNTSSLVAGEPFILTTWDFGPGANEVGFPILQAGGSAIDAVEAAINYVDFCQTNIGSVMAVCPMRWERPPLMR